MAAAAKPWNDRQREFIDHPLGAGRLLGVPGGGKTRCLLGRVLRLTDDGEIPARGFLVVAFSKLAVADFLRKGREMREGTFDETNVRTVHSLAGSIVSQLLGRTGDSSVATVVHRARVEVERCGEEALRSQILGLRAVAAVFVDEAQDMSPVQYEFAVALAAKLRAPLCLVGDPNQSIYQFQGGTDRFLREHPGFSVSLTLNHRSTASICAVVDACKPVASGDAVVSARAGDAGPRLELVCDHQRLVTADVADRAAAALARGMTVAVIGPVRRSSERHGHFLNLGLSMMAAELARRGVPFAVHYREDVAPGDAGDAGEAGDSRRGGDPTALGTVHLLTAHASKGLEFDAVLVINYHARAMGALPSACERGALGCMWYVAMSRARRELTVYCDASSAVWPGYLDIARHVRLVGREPRRQTAPARDAPPALAHSWAALLRDPVRLNERRRTTLEDSMAARLERLAGPLDAAGGGEPPSLPDEDQLSSLYAAWARNTFAHHYRGAPPPVLVRLEALVRAIAVPPEMNGMVRQLWAALGAAPGAPVPWPVLDRHRQALQGTTAAPLLEFLDAQRPAPPSPDDVTVRCGSDLRWWHPGEATRLAETARAEMRAGRIALATMWRMCLLEWQDECECGYRWAMDDAPVLEALRPHHARIAEAAAAEPDGMRLRAPLALQHLPVVATADAVDEARRRVVGLAFSRSVGSVHALEVTGLVEMAGGRDPHLWEAQVYNLRDGAVYTVRNNLADRAARWSVACVLSEAVDKPLQDTSWLYDLETTGLDTERCGILEIHMEEYVSGLVPVSTLVRQSHVPARVTEITGISAADTAHAPGEAEVVERFRAALARCRRPRLLAHNGIRFDHAIMRRHGAIPGDARLVDTMRLFPLAAMPRRVPGERRALARIYAAVMGREFDGGAHRAEADVRMMRDVLDAAGMRERGEAMM
eukprot:jgi/Tetstr1/454029/TSEL_040948.t1